MSERILKLKNLPLSQDPFVIVTGSDHLWREDIVQTVITAFKEARVEEIPTEHSFIQRIPYWRKNTPSLFIIACQNRWTDPAPRMPVPPKDVREEGFEASGIRCIKRLSLNPPLDKVPTIYFCTASMSGDHLRYKTLPDSVYIGGFADIPGSSYETTSEQRTRLFF